MNSSESTPNVHLPIRRRASQWMLPVVLLAVIAGAFVLIMILPPHWHALLELKNSGTKSMTVVFKGQTTVTEPGQTWKGEFRAGDTIAIGAGEPADAWFNLLMPAKNPKPWTSAFSTVQHWTADVNADDPANIRVEKRVWTEVTSPPSPWVPWP